MQTVLFDVLPKAGCVEQYFSMAAELKPLVEQNPGFLSVERFVNLHDQSWYLSFSCWENEASLAQWRCQPDHNNAQVCGRHQIFDDYRLRVSATSGEQQLTDKITKERILLFIGQFDDLQKSLPQLQFTDVEHRSYQGVLNPGRGISIIEFPPAAAMNLNTFQLSLPDTVECLWLDVLRDYGMFDRTEAPTEFV